MAELNKKNEVDVYLAKIKIENKGLKPFQTKLSETDCKVVEKNKKFLFINYKSKEIEITPEYAVQVINIDELSSYKKILEDCKYKFTAQIGERNFNLIYNNVYYALATYKLKLDEVQIDSYIEKLVALCGNKIEKNVDYYGHHFSINPLFEQEKKFLTSLLRYNRQKISNHQKANLNDSQLVKKHSELTIEQ